MRKILIMAVAASMFIWVGSAWAVTIDYSYDVDSSGGFTSKVSGATVETFDTYLQWKWDGDFAVVKGSQSGQYAAPYGPVTANTTNYVTVPREKSNGQVKVTDLGGTYNYFGLWWGSIDTYNSLEFYLGERLLLTITGSQISSSPDGSWTKSESNKYVNFFDLPYFDSFSMISTSKAFEVDNIAIARVPEPGTLLLFGTGLAGLAVNRH